MIIFVDTSAFLAVLDRDDRNHVRAARTWKTLLEGDAMLLTSSYVLLETVSLLQARFGLQAIHVFQEDLAPLLTVDWVEADLHHVGMAAVLMAGRRGLSLTDCISFEIMRRRGIRKGFAFDRHFQEQGFENVS